MKKSIAILGSTGSIGTQSLEVIETHPDKFEVEVISAFNNTRLLIEQAKKYHPNVVVIANEEKYAEVKAALASEPVKIFAGEEALNQVVQMDSIDMVLTALVGFSGLLPTYHAIKAGKDIALANKETLVVAGEIITKLAKEKEVNILPVDSEHSAIFQCMAGEYMNQIEKIYLTCSGGPFRGRTLDEMQHITPEDALDHPNWEMGDKITIDSASLINKGFEVIEAHWLFGLPARDIEVVVHPQSIIHSIVQFTDGAMKAQMGLPDMKLPIQYALSFPERFATNFPRFNFLDFPTLDFERPNTKIFRNLALSYEALEQGGNMPCVLNAANEIVVSAFLEGQVRFVQLPEIIEEVMQKAEIIQHASLEDFVLTDNETRKITRLLIEKRK
ncbi:MAG: 1-deoxy-D-xylulose-5-phosphate reductoisomerase [Chlorobi bacterium]|nr:1-deoxy-D-xylulose-5-phosphate reductoisomerase [Chlorobiota bacterium]